MEILGTKTFKPKFDYTELELQALKMMEEAAEVHQAVKRLADTDDILSEDIRRHDVEYELSDYFQSGFNFADMFGLAEEDVLDIMHDCWRRNEIRGRYQ